MFAACVQASWQIKNLDLVAVYICLQSELTHFILQTRAVQDICKTSMSHNLKISAVELYMVTLLLHVVHTSKSNYKIRLITVPQFMLEYSALLLSITKCKLYMPTIFILGKPAGKVGVTSRKATPTGPATTLGPPTKVSNVYV